MSAGPRDAAVKIVQRLRDAGHIAYFAGGCVRDELLGLSPTDYDVATEARPDVVAGLFRGSREVGKAFGVMLVRVSGVTVEVSTFRREGPYSDRRRPDEVTFCDARSDAFRRDFTVNALFIDPLAGAPGGPGEVIDFVDGKADLSRRVIRAVGDPDQRLSEDHLRALRAARIAARLGFEIDTPTADAIRRHARQLAGVSRERIGDEIRRMLCDPNRARAVRLVRELGLEGPVLDPERRAGEHIPSPLSATVIERLPVSSGFALSLAAWEIDRMDSAAGDGSRVAIDVIEARQPPAASRLRAAICLSNEERDSFTSAWSSLVFLERDWENAAVARRKRGAADPGFAMGLALLRSRQPQVADDRERELRALAQTPGGVAPPPLVTGDDLIAAGLPASPAFGRWLEQAYDEQLEGRIGSKEEAVARVREWASAASKSRNP